MAEDRPRKTVGHKGRGAVGNVDNRYHRQQTEPFDDGWGQDASQPLRTTLSIDRSRGAISYNDSPDVPFDRSLNPYRGCEHGCIYCYARPTHAWLDLSPGLDFESRLFMKPDLPALLRDELSRAGYRPALMAIGSVTDGYQPVEREQGITRAVLQVLREARHPLVVITKSSLVERDIDLLGEMAADGLAEVAVSVTTLRPDMARTLEPRAAAPRRRLQTISRLAQAGIPVRVMVAPVVPVLTDPELEEILRAAREAGAYAAAYILLRLPLEVAPLFRDWLQAHHPHSAEHVMGRLRDSRGGKDNVSRFGERMRGIGQYAGLIEQRFRLAQRQLGFRMDNVPRVDLFRPPGRGGQLPLL